MNLKPRPKTIILAEDDPDDIYLITEAIDECQLDAKVFLVQDGEELMDFLFHRGEYAGAPEQTRPDLILLDLNMPRKDGREVLAELKQDPVLRTIPVVVLTTSQAEEDLQRSYAEGASGFISKPVSFKGLREVIGSIGAYWLNTVRLPEKTDQEEGGI